MNDSITQRHLTIEEICKALRVSRATLWRWTNEQGLPVYRIGGVIRYQADKVEAWLQKHKTGDADFRGLFTPFCAADTSIATGYPHGSGTPGQEERNVNQLLEEQNKLLREIRDLLKAKWILTMACVPDV